MFLLLIISMLIGWFTGGPDQESRRVLATSTGMRSAWDGTNCGLRRRKHRVHSVSRMSDRMRPVLS